MTQRALAKSRWRFLKKKGCNTSTFLRALGIEFRENSEADDSSFMRVNAHILPELYEQMQEEARLRMHELHPDKGGNATEFRAFIETYDIIKKRFAWHLPPKPIGEEKQSEVLEVSRGVFKSPGRAFEIMHLIKQGLSNREIARAVRADRGTVRKARRAMNGSAPLCGCGKPATHQGWCATKLARYPKRQHFLAVEIAKLPQNMTGPPGCRLPKSTEHRHRIADALRGKLKSHQVA